MSTSRVFTDAAKLLSPYIEAPDRHSLTSELIRAGSDPQTLAGKTDPPDKSIERLGMELFEVIDGGISMNTFTLNLDKFLSSGGQVDKTAAEYIRQFMRISFPGGQDDHRSIEPDREKVCYTNDLRNYEVSIPSGQETSLSLFEGGITNVDGEGGKSRAIENLYAVELLNPRLGISNRDTPSIGIFTSLISTLEMSRCVPYVNIRVKSSSSAPENGEESRYSGISLMTYLNGQQEKSPGNGLDTIMSFEKTGQMRSAGMEIFTSPQTLVPTRDSAVFRETNRGADGKTNNIAPVLDRFRPLMTLRGLSFSVASSKGFMSYKSGKMEVTLHDRSRLSEVASFVRPGLYNKTEIDIEYGWSHPTGYPDPGSSSGMQGGNSASTNLDFRNPIGAFLNSMRVREKYGIVNSSYSFEDNGQVNISLSLAMKGSSDIVSTDISACGSSDEAKELQTALEEISEISKSLKSSDSERFGKVFGDVIMTAVGTTSSALAIDGEKLKELKEAIKKVRTSNAAESSLLSKIDNLYNSTASPLQQFKASAAGAIQNELNLLKSGKEIFPFSDLQILKPELTSIEVYPSLGDIASLSINEPISLGRILLSFVGKALAKNSEYGEVHFLFHTFNDKCTFMRDLSIAKFPIPYDELEKEIKEYVQKHTKIPIMQFIGMLNSRFVGNMASKAYGFNFLFDYDEESESYKRKEPKDESSKKDKEKFQQQQYSRQDRVLDYSGIRDGTFKLPKLSIYPECVPDKDDQRKSILRMHVVDETCASFSTLSDLLRASNSVDIGMFGFTNDPKHPSLTLAPEQNQSKIKERREKILSELTGSGVIKRAVETIEVRGKNPEIVTELEIDAGALLEGKSLSATKRFISRGIPTIKYGREGGTIKSIGLQSISDPGLANVNILRMAKTDQTTPDLTMQRGLPIQVAPTECSIEMMGCPLLSFGQQFFIDFDTGTTADNTYNVTGIEHKIDPGSFTSSVKLTFTDSYGKYTSQAKKVKTASALIKAKQGFVDPIDEPDPEHPSSSKISSNYANPPLFFKAVGISRSDITKMISDSYKEGLTVFEFAVVVPSKKGNNFAYFKGKDSVSNAIKESKKHQDCFIIYTSLTSESQGIIEVKVTDGKTSKMATKSRCDEISSYLGTTIDHGKIAINVDEFQFEYAKFLGKRS
jgi:hypothetical protein